MAFQILLNALIAIVWMFLSTSFTPQTFVIGYLIGILILLVMRRYFKERFYLGWIWATIKLILIFLRELVMSNITVLRIVLDPKMNIKSAVVAFSTELESHCKIMLLANLVTLTPRTLVVHVSDDQRRLCIHALDIQSAEDENNSIKDSF